MASRMAEYREKSRRRKEMLKVTIGGVVILNCAKTLAGRFASHGNNPANTIFIYFLLELRNIYLL